MLGNLVVALAISKHKHINKNRIELDDLIQEARLGLMVASHLPELEHYTLVDGTVVNYVKQLARYRMSVHIAEFSNSAVSVPHRSYYRNGNNIQCTTIDTLINEVDPETELIDKENKHNFYGKLQTFVLKLKRREKYIFINRMWTVSPKTLRSVAKVLKISYEWVRKIEAAIETSMIQHFKDRK